MLMLLLRIGDNRYALDTQSVVEVIPRVEVKSIHGTPPAIVGLLNYQGMLVPVIDLGQLLGHPTPPPTLSTRIILVHQGQAGENRRLLGLLAEQVIEILDSTTVTTAIADATLLDSPYLEAILLQRQEMIQLLQVEAVLDEQVYAALLSKAEVFPVEADLAVVGQT